MDALDHHLVYQAIPPAQPNDAFAKALQSIVESSDTIVLVSPYLSVEIIEKLTEGREFRLVTDIEEALQAQSAKLCSFVEQHHSSIRSLRGLHAKVALGQQAGLLGSANLTKTGLSRRFEMSCVVHGAAFEELAAWCEALWDHADAIELDKLQELRSRTRGRQFSDEHRSLPTTGQLGWLARPLSPPRLPEQVSVEDVDELAEALGKLTADATSARTVLSLLARALECTELDVDDERLHLNFGGSAAISVTVGQRYVAWCGRGREFGMMLQSFELAKLAARDIEGARWDAFTKNGEDDVPSFYIPTEAFDRLEDMVMRDWERAIRQQAKSAGRSNYLDKKRPELYHILKDEMLCAYVARHAHQNSQDHSEQP